MTNYFFQFDLDGVLADWDKSFTKRFGDISQYTEQEFKIIKYIISTDDFYSTLDIIEDGFKLLEYCSQIGTVEILTSAGKYNTERVANLKYRWLINKLDKVPKFIYTTSSKDKANHAKENSILIDDRMKAITPYIEIGGKAILFTSYEDAVKQILEIKKRES